MSFAILTDATGREEALFLPETLLTSWQYKRRLQKQADQLLEVTKQQLQDLPLTGQSPSTQQRFSHLKAARAPGLWRLFQVLEQEGAADAAIQLLRHWASCSTKLLREARGLEQRYLGHRDWFYHNLALQLCHRYQQLVVTVSDITATSARARHQNIIVARSRESANLSPACSPELAFYPFCPPSSRQDWHDSERSICGLQHVGHYRQRRPLVSRPSSAGKKLKL